MVNVIHVTWVSFQSGSKSFFFGLNFILIFELFYFGFQTFAFWFRPMNSFFLNTIQVFEAPSLLISSWKENDEGTTELTQKTTASLF